MPPKVPRPMTSALPGPASSPFPRVSRIPKDENRITKALRPTRGKPWRKLAIGITLLLMASLSSCECNQSSNDWAKDLRQWNQRREDEHEGLSGTAGMLELKQRYRDLEEKDDQAVGPEAKIPNSANALKAADFLHEAQKDGQTTMASPERVYQRSVDRYGEANTNAAFKAGGWEPPAPYPTAQAMVTAQAKKDADAHATAVAATPRALPTIALTPTPAAAFGGTFFSEEEAPKGDPIQVFKVGNDAGVQNGGTPSRFTIAKDHWVTQLWTYHWNGGQGKPAGTISLQTADGKAIYGPWQAELVNGVYWMAKPSTWLPAGSYLVIDSDPSTFAQNPGSDGQGMSWMFGIPRP